MENLLSEYHDFMLTHNEFRKDIVIDMFLIKKNMRCPIKNALVNICNDRKIDYSRLMSRERKRELASLRQQIIASLIEYGWGYRKSGNVFNIKRSTAWHALNTVKSLCLYDKKYKAEYDEVKNLVNNYFFCGNNPNGQPT